MHFYCPRVTVDFEINENRPKKKEKEKIIYERN